MKEEERGGKRLVIGQVASEWAWMGGEWALGSRRGEEGGTVGGKGWHVEACGVSGWAEGG